METLPSQFEKALTLIEINGKKRERAIKAHEEMRAVLAVDLPYAAVRRHVGTEAMPSWLERDVGAAARALLVAWSAG